MGKICYLHVGMYKTGSTSIQSSLYNSRNTLSNKYNIQLYYGKEDGFKHFFLPLASALEHYNNHLDIAYPTWYKNEVSLDQKKAEWEHLEQFLNNNNKIIITSEEFFMQSLDTLTSLKNLILEYGFNIKVLLYVRNPYTYLSSWWQQKLKEADISSLKKINIHQYLKDTMSVWEDEISIRKFERRYLYNNDILDDFCQWLGDPNIRADLIEPTASNIGYNNSSTILAYNIANQLNIEKLDPVFYYTFSKISKHNLDTDKFILSKSLIENDLKKDSLNQWIDLLKKHFGDKYDYPELEYPDYDINSLSSVEDRYILEIIQKAYQDNYNLSKDYHLHTQEIDRLNQEWDKLNIALTKRDQEIKRINTEWSKLNIALTKRDQEIKRVNTEWSKLNDALTKRDQEIERVNTEWSKLNDALTKRDQEIERINTEWAKLNDTLTKRNQEIRERDQEIKRLNEEWKKLDNYAINLKNQLQMIDKNKPSLKDILHAAFSKKSRNKLRFFK